MTAVDVLERCTDAVMTGHPAAIGACVLGVGVLVVRHVRRRQRRHDHISYRDGKFTQITPPWKDRRP